MDHSLDSCLPAERHIVHRLGAQSWLSHYHRLFMLVIVANLVWLGVAPRAGNAMLATLLAPSTLADLVVVNLSIAVLVRQQYVVNLLFWIATRAPTTWPLAIRRSLAKVYHFGGLHSGCAAAATAWFAIHVMALTVQAVEGEPGATWERMTLAYALLGVLLLIVIMALPAMRARFHNGFERVHRFGGWTALALFWAQTIALANDDSASLGGALISSFSFWMLLAVSVSVALPWLRLRKVAVEVERPSSHAVVVRFDHGVTPFFGSSTAISRNPLLEWHSFANIPAPGEAGFRIIISRAGDWTGTFIEDPPRHVWVKGITTAGVAHIETLFRSVVYIATGSGIGPVLPHLLARRLPIRLIWSTRPPRKTYGDGIVDEILAAQPDALIWDTDERDKPDLLELAYEGYASSGAEAVICIANRSLTNRVVTGLESRGIPAYGAIWDS
ncbi:hypothetical protein [Pararobbsia alpina]|uniref:Uncharacterized protein n=1 Tax=Pararobbsia alpina TaxID=621374 RepID=A0A6S7BA58_9BURK|nr:hypothetical protein [Pararobbsia alpina]CAB3793330.1 hypothetical protein LMG28138_03509 [Pararobbsia alpina]